MPDIAYLNGRFMPLEQASVSIEDRGVQFGDGVYEVIRTYGGKPFELEAHLRRLDRSAKAIALANPHELREWVEIVNEAIRQAAYPESKIYIQITRGVAPRDHAFPTGVRPTTILTLREMRPLDPSLQGSGVAVITMEDVRWGRCDIKSINLLPNVLARQRAWDAGAFEALFVRDGVVTEGAVSNVMMVSRRRLATAAEGPTILSGVTRQLILALARRDGMALEERPVRLEELRRADEVFLTGTTLEVLPVIRVDGRPVGSGRPGPTATHLLSLFRQLTV